MRQVLHILTENADALAEQVIRWQEQWPAPRIETVDLRKPEPDYEKLLQQIFAADSIQSW